jgi:hypothetical protein
VSFVGVPVVFALGFGLSVLRRAILLRAVMAEYPVLKAMVEVRIVHSGSSNRH